MICNPGWQGNVEVCLMVIHFLLTGKSEQFSSSSQACMCYFFFFSWQITWSGLSRGCARGEREGVLSSSPISVTMLRDVGYWLTVAEPQFHHRSNEESEHMIFKLLCCSKSPVLWFINSYFSCLLTDLFILWCRLGLAVLSSSAICSTFSFLSSRGRFLWTWIASTAFLCTWPQWHLWGRQWCWRKGPNKTLSRSEVGEALRASISTFSKLKPLMLCVALCEGREPWVTESPPGPAIQPSVGQCPCSSNIPCLQLSTSFSWRKGLGHLVEPTPSSMVNASEIVPSLGPCSHLAIQTAFHI